MDKSKIIQELQFKATRSSGAGGQHVNKVSSKIELIFYLQNSTGFTTREKQRLSIKLANRLTKDGLFLLQCDESRSQHKNKELVIKRFFSVIKNALVVKKKRIKTKPSKSAIEKRLQKKKKLSMKKVNRGKPSFD